MENNLLKTESDALKSIIGNKELIIQKADKGNTVVLLNRKGYISKMILILVNISKFQKIKIDDSKVLNHSIQMENNFKNLKKKKTFLIKSIMNYTLQVQDQVFYIN